MSDELKGCLSLPGTSARAIESQKVKVTRAGAAVVLPPLICLLEREYNSRSNVSLII